MQMQSCERCKSYMVEGQIECAICGFDPNAVPEPAPEPVHSPDHLAEAPVDGPVVFERRSAGATPFLAVGALVVAVVAFLIVSGSDVFGTGDDLPQAGAALATDDTVYTPWNNDEGGEVGSGDAELVDKFVAACNSGRAVAEATPYTRARGAHPIVIVDQRFGNRFTSVDNPLQRNVVPRQLTPAPLNRAELLLCAGDSAEAGVDTVFCPADPTSEPEELPLAGNDTEYRLVVAATGETVWSFSKVFPPEFADQCQPDMYDGWQVERLEFPETQVWPEVSEWVMSNGRPLDAQADPAAADDDGDPSDAATDG